MPQTQNLRVIVTQIEQYQSLGGVGSVNGCRDLPVGHEGKQLRMPKKRTP
jgi:hypothetical protein